MMLREYACSTGTVRYHDKKPAGLDKGTLGFLGICISFSFFNEKLRKPNPSGAFQGPWFLVEVSSGANRIVLRSEDVGVGEY